MPACPKCGGRKLVGAKSFLALAEPLAPRAGSASVKISIVQCEKCGAEFPTIESRKKYLLAPAEELAKVKKAVETQKSDNESMNASLKEMAVKEAELRVSIDTMTSEGEVKILENRYEVMLASVSYLRSEKERLESLYSTLSLAAPLVVSAGRTKS